MCLLFFCFVIVYFEYISLSSESLNDAAAAAHANSGYAWNVYQLC